MYSLSPLPLHFIVLLSLFFLQSTSANPQQASASSSSSTPAPAPEEINGQLFTAGLSIVDAPAPNSTQHAGSNLSIAIDLSGDGRLPSSAYTPGSNLATRLDSLQIFLVSDSLKINYTIASSADGSAEAVLEQEPGSTVKHVNWEIVGDCVPSGGYNLTFYEFSHINDQAFFTITALPLTIDNTITTAAPNSNCALQPNALQALPQPSSPPPQAPFISPLPSLNTGLAAPTDTIVPPPNVSNFPGSSGGAKPPSSVSGGQVRTTTVMQTRTYTVTAETTLVSVVTQTQGGSTILETTTITNDLTSTFTSATPAVSFIPVNGGAGSLKSPFSYSGQFSWLFIYISTSMIAFTVANIIL